VKLVRRKGLFLFAASIAFAAAPAHAQSVEEFYSNRVVELYIGFSVGGGYDAYGRLVARHIGKHIPGNPTVVPVNMDGAGSLKLANWLYNAAPRDGTVIGTVNRGVPFEPLVGVREMARFDATEFTWLGSANDEITVCVAWKRTGIESFDELYERELIVSGTGQAGDDPIVRMIAGVLGSQIRLVTGYAGANEANFAMERGEVDGRCAWSWSSVVSTRRNWLDNGDIKVLLQLGFRKHPDLPDVPLILDLAESEEDLQIMRLVLVRGVLGRPFLAPPNLPADRAAALQEAFAATVIDPDFLREAARQRMEVIPISGAEIQALVAEAYATPEHVIEKTREILR
jgi:tripartite-type tricarboxylate transporter receptor subunit TctC